jgi:hypothetical protein
MIPDRRTRIIVIAIVAALAGAALGFWGYGAHQKRQLDKAVVALVQDASQRLREALSVETGPAPADREATVRKLDEHAAEVDRRLQELKRMDASRNLALADATDSYLLTVREILRYQASSHWFRLGLSESTQALRDHMRADDRSGSWVREAVRAKEQVNKDYRDYRLASDAFRTLVESFPADQAKIAPYVGASPLIDQNLVGTARERALEASMQTAAEVEKVKQLEAFR